MKLIILLLCIFIICVWIRSLRNPASGSGGLSPDGGMRDNTMTQSELKYSPITYNNYEPYLYDTEMIPEPMVWKVGHWSQ